MDKYRMQDVLQDKWHKLHKKLYTLKFKKKKRQRGCLRFKTTNKAYKSNASTFTGS